MKILLKKPIITIVFLFSICIAVSSCSKSDNTTTSSQSNQQFFETDFINHDLTLSLVTENGNDITNQFSKYIFRFSKTAALSGTISIQNTDSLLTGMWTIDGTYSNLTISISPAPTPFPFLNTTFIFLHPSSFTLGTLDRNDTKIITFSKL